MIAKKIRKIKNKEHAKNPRNKASGLSKQKDGSGCEDLRIVFYDAWNNNSPFESEINKLSWMNNNGFNTVPTRYASSAEQVIDFWKETSDERSNLEYAIDGIVVKENQIDYEDLKRSRPEKQVAFKFSSNIVVTKIVDVEWSISGKNLTPIAILEPVELLGTTVKKASLANPNRLRELNLNSGDEVAITKRGDIIPRIEYVVHHNENGKPLIEVPSTHALSDGSVWNVIDEGTRAIISGDDFPEIRYHRVEKWFSVLDVKGFGPKLLSDLFDRNYIEDIPDLYTMDVEAYLNEIGNHKAVRKAFDNLFSINEVSLEYFLAGFDIESIGRRIFASVVSAGFDTLDKIYNAEKEELSKIEGISEDRASKIIDGVRSLYPKMKEVLDSGKISISSKKEGTKVKDDALKGLTVCFTGKLESMTRDEAFQVVREYGGTPTNTMSLNVSYLITNTPNSGTQKNKKANQYGTTIISEDDFFHKLATGKLT